MGVGEALEELRLAVYGHRVAGPKLEGQSDVLAEFLARYQAEVMVKADALARDAALWGLDEGYRIAHILDTKYRIKARHEARAAIERGEIGGWP